MPTAFWGQNPNPTQASPWNAPNFQPRFQKPMGTGSEAPFDYSVGEWTPRYQNFINNLPVEYIKAKLGNLRNFTGMADPQVRNLAFGYANQLGYVGSPSVTAAMKGPSTPAPANAIFPKYNAPTTPMMTATPLPQKTAKLASFGAFPAYNSGNRFRMTTR